MKFNPVLFATVLLVVLSSCGNLGRSNTPAVVYKGVYSFGPQVKSFKDCETGSDFWVSGNCAALDTQYNHINFEKPYEPVYVEVEASKVKATKADALDSQYDSIIVIKKVNKVTKVIPDVCN